VIRRALLAAGGLALVLAGAEGFLALLDAPSFDACDMTSSYSVGDPVLGFRGDPSLPVAGVTPNRLGLRGPVPPTPKPEGELRLLFLGDSTCWGLGVSLDGTFGARVAGMAGPDASFLLGAFPSYSSYHSAVLLDRLLPFEPDAVVLYVGARNDGDRARYYADSDIPARRARLDAGWHRLRVLRALEGGFDRMTMLVRRLWDEPAQARVPPEAFRHNLEHMLEQLAQAGIPAFVVLPVVSRGFETEHPLFRRYRDILVEVAARESAVVVDLEAVLGEQADAERFFFPDGFHLSEEGHRATALAVHAVLVENGLVAGPSQEGSARGAEPAASERDAFAR
jgi:lysophospholipase L1-like esterase